MKTFAKFINENATKNQLKILMLGKDKDDVVVTNLAFKRADFNYVLEAVEDAQSIVDYLENCLSSSKKSVPEIIILDREKLSKQALESIHSFKVKNNLSNLNLVVISSEDLEEIDQENVFESVKILNYLTRPLNNCKVRSLENSLTKWRKEQLKVVSEAVCDLSESCRNDSEKLRLLDHVQSRGDEVLLLLEQIEKEHRVTPIRKTYEVLLIEDNRGDAILIKQNLKAAFPDEFRITHLSTLTDGLRAIQEGNFDVIVTDLKLPDGSGIGVFKAIYKEARTTPVVILSGQAESSYALQAMKLGAQDYVVKDINRYGEILGRSIKYAIERKHVESLCNQSLKIEQDVLKEALAASPLLVVRIDHQLEIKSLNQEFASVCRMSQNELLGKKITNVISNLDENRVKSVVCEGSTFSQEQMWVNTIGKDYSSNYFFDVVAWPIKKLVNDRKEAILLFTDVSERVGLAKQRDEFIAALAHDIRNPLVGELRVLDAILKGSLGEISDPMKKVLKSVVKSNNSLLLMLSNMVDVYKLEGDGTSLCLDTIDFCDLVARVVRDMDFLNYGSNVTVEFEKRDDNCIIEGDVSTLKRVVQNLVFNAVKYAEPFSVVSLTVSNEEDQEVILRVTNQGPTIDPSDQMHLFDRFAQGSKEKQNSNSSGFGLYLCNKIVEGHGGLIGCTSHNGETTFIVALPKAIR